MQFVCSSGLFGTDQDLWVWWSNLGIPCKRSAFSKVLCWSSYRTWLQMLASIAAYASYGFKLVLSVFCIVVYSSKQNLPRADWQIFRRAFNMYISRRTCVSYLLKCLRSSRRAMQSLLYQFQTFYRKVCGQGRCALLRHDYLHYRIVRCSLW
jgi:hypothetical protein